MIRRGAAGEESRRARAFAQAVGEDHPRSGQQGRRRLLRAQRAHPYLDKLGFNSSLRLHHCIGNSGPLQPEISAAVAEGDLAVVSVLSGNRNFEGRINPDVKMNYLASPPLVVAYALAGTMDLDITKDPLGVGSDGEPV